MRPLCAIAIAVLSTTSVTAQMDADVGARLLREPAVRGALDIARATETATIDEQVRLCEIPAPPFKEAARPPPTPTLSRGGLEKRADRQRR